MIKIIFALLFCLTFQTASIFAQAPRSYTSSEILLQLKKLNTVGSVLYIAAHPDDENTRLIAYLANEKCLRTGYLSLTRGDGGQNLIGPEQGVELGIIRTQELLAARRIDGAEQFFTRAYDFGYSKTPKETFEKWNHDSVLADVVWVIRNFRPDIIITRFATDGSGGHGHHTASAILSEEAFDAAADPKRFPEQLKWLDVWQTRRMFHNSTARFFNPNADLSKLIKLDVGGYNVLLGKSYGEIAAESRSMHRSQGFGSAKQRGESFEYFKPVKGDTANLKGIFDGIDFSWKRVKGGEEIDKTLNECINAFDFSEPGKLTNSIVSYYNWLEKKDFYYHRNMIRQFLLSVNAIVFEPISSSPFFCNNDSITISYSLIKRSKNKVSFTAIGGPFFAFEQDSILSENKLVKLESKLTSMPSARLNYISPPFWLRNKLKNNLFDIPRIDMRSLAEIEFPTLEGIADIKYNDFQLEYIKAISYKWVDPSRGELYRPLVITPPVMMNMQNEVIIYDGYYSKEVKINLKAGKDNIKGNIKVNLPSGWKVANSNSIYEDMEYTLSGGGHSSALNNTNSKDFQLTRKGEEQIVSFWIYPPDKTSEAILKASAEVGGQVYNKGIKEIKYDHIPIQTWFPDAEAKLVRLDITKKSKYIGYIPGAGDEVQQCLQQLGYEVTTLTDEMLSKENLSQFDAIITGVRAYNVNEKLPNFKPKLMDYVNNGGNLIVQYNTNNFIGQMKGDFGPYPFKITRDRVTDENAKVNFELPNHPVLNTPNKITDKDFDGWIQERCIYTASDSTGKYEMPLSMADENEKPNKGSLIIAKHGKGNFIYTGLVFFRELPAGVPGAYRLFVNLIELGK